MINLRKYFMSSTYNLFLHMELVFGVQHIYIYHAHVNKLETTINSLPTYLYLFNLPKLFPTISLYKELEILNMDYLYLLWVCTLLFQHKLPTHYYQYILILHVISKISTNLMIPRLRTSFAQSKCICKLLC